MSIMPLGWLRPISAIEDCVAAEDWFHHMGAGGRVDGFEESELGLVPRGWRVSRLVEMSGYLNRGVSPKYIERDGILVINQKCIRDFSIDYSKARRHDFTQKGFAGRELQQGDVLVNSTGVGTLGRVAQVLDLPETSIVDSHVTIVRTGSDLTWPYLGEFMMCKQPEIEAMGEGNTGQTELSRGKLCEIRLLVPSRAALTSFDAIVMPIKNRMTTNARQIETLASLRDTLLPRLISGKLRLPESETVVEETAA